MNTPLIYSKPILRPVLDLTVSAWVKQHGDIQVFGTWYLDVDGEAPWPCMVLVPAFKSMQHSYAPCVVSLDLAWIWDEPPRGDPEFAMETAMSFCDSLGLSVNFKNCTRVASIIRDHLGDLLAIPPRPKSLEQVVADGLVTDEQGRQHHKEIVDV